MNRPESVHTVLGYHQRTKHQLGQYAAGPDTLDWDAQPNPFREFAGSHRVYLPLMDTAPSPAFSDLATAPSQPLNLATLARLLALSLGLAVWKQYGQSRWALRCTPSSGNLHPTEGYVLALGIEGLDTGVYHYLSQEHVLELRQGEAHPTGPQATSPITEQRLLIGLTSIHWREAWKYGERAFRYCQLDIGHALAALRYAAASLGWTLRLREDLIGAELAALLGLDRSDDFAHAEREEADLLLEIILFPEANTAPLDIHSAFGAGQWTGQANQLDPHPMYHWPVIETVAAASSQSTLDSAHTIKPSSPNWPPPTPFGARAAAEIIRGRRSAQRFDKNQSITQEAFFHLLDSLLPRPDCIPWDSWDFAPRIHPLLFVHRVEGLAPGLYALPRSPQGEITLRTALNPNFEWLPASGKPAHLPLYRLYTSDTRRMINTLSCQQPIAADSGFSLAMLAEFAPLITENPWRYRQLHWEAGLIGQVLYLTAETLGLRGTGIGCFYDDAVHDVFGLKDDRLQSLYHFTVGHPLLDSRIATLPPYPNRQAGDVTGSLQ